MKNIFKFLANFLYAFLIGLFIAIYADINKGSEWTTVALVLTVFFGAVALVGIAGYLAVLICEARKEKKANKTE